MSDTQDQRKTIESDDKNPNVAKKSANNSFKLSTRTNRDKNRNRKNEMISKRRNNDGSDHHKPKRSRVCNSPMSIDGGNKIQAKEQPNASQNSSKEKKQSSRSLKNQFPKLDKSNPVHARRMEQRLRAVSFGKNTVGYDEYIKKVPKSKRKHKPICMRYPATPDHTLDIPTKRWQGLVKAWRKALHQYDPPDLMKSLNNENGSGDNDSDKKVAITPKKLSMQERQLEEAESQGLLVDLSNRSPRFCSPASVLTADSTKSGGLSVMDAETAFVCKTDSATTPTKPSWADICDSDNDDDDDDLL